MGASTVSFDALDAQQEMRLSIKAGRRIERALGVPYAKMLSELDERLGFEFLVQFFGACLDDGQGVSERQAERVLDHIGFERANEIVLDVALAASPSASGGESSGNGRRRATSK